LVLAPDRGASPWLVRKGTCPAALFHNAADRKRSTTNLYVIKDTANLVVAGGSAFVLSQMSSRWLGLNCFIDDAWR